MTREGPPDAGQKLFEERYAMAQSQKSLWTRMVSTWRCVFVRLTPRRLEVGLHGLLGLLVRPFGADIDHSVELDRVTEVSIRRRVLGRGEVSVTFSLPKGGRRTLLLYLKRADELVAIMHGMGSGRPAEG